MEKEKRKKVSRKSITIVVIILLILVLIAGITIYFMNRPQEIEIVSKEKSNIEAMTNIQNLEIMNVITEENMDRNQTKTVYIMIKNVANIERAIEDISIELIDANGTMKGSINGYIPLVGANSTYEVKAITNIDVSDVAKVNIISAKKD